MTVIKAQNAVKEYVRKGETVYALRGVDLEIKAGEFTAIVGPSGSGKSTFLRLAGCLDTLTGGTLLVDGEDTGTMKSGELDTLHRQKISFIFQNLKLNPELSAEENITHPLSLLGMSRKEIKERCTSALADVGLERKAKGLPGEMTASQRQRLAIARALAKVRRAKRPVIILADEPTSHQGSAMGREILKLMLEINKKEGATFVFSTHDRKVMDNARRIIRMRDGQIESDEGVNHGQSNTFCGQRVRPGNGLLHHLI